MSSEPAPDELFAELEQLDASWKDVKVEWADFFAGPSVRISNNVSAIIRTQQALLREAAAALSSLYTAHDTGQGILPAKEATRAVLAKLEAAGVR